MKKEIYLAGGCFWGVEKYFSLVPGVLEVEVGYANGHTKNPTYEEVCVGNTGFAEAVYVVYDGEQTDLGALLENFYRIIDPTTLNRQAGDVGSQYRTGIYFTDPAEKAAIAASLAELQKQYDAPIVVENLPLSNYYKAEEYHQKYLEKNPEGYCHIPRSMYDEVAKA
ncbi:MAG: peptide-methionine (S)-S-oxide reductase MsrA [Clostridiales bacterium]|jgi:methionine-S-sulfoxide reductase|nr:peptide-methionine (S)-S-oxide reductase MsrA [Clostridiales bacterium]